MNQSSKSLPIVQLDQDQSVQRAQVRPAVGSAHRGESGLHWWRSLEELADTTEFRDYLHREFPENATQWLSGSRRDFLRLMSASLFLAGVSGCDIRQPQEQIIPSALATRHAMPGLPLYFSTAYDFCGSALGLTVQSRDGRPIKIEGNANHPASLGATNVFAQAATLDLYDPDRASTPQQNGRLSTLVSLRDALDALRIELDDSQGEGFCILLGTTTSPTLRRLLESVEKRWSKSQWYVYESVNDDHQRAGQVLAVGELGAELAPVADLRQAKVILSIDCDFLAARDVPVCYVNQFAESRRIAGREDDQPLSASSMSRLYHLGPTPTPTSAKADHALALKPSQIPALVHRLASSLGVIDTLPQKPPHEESADVQDWLERVTADLKAAEGNMLVLVGREQPPVVHALAYAINAKLEAIGKTQRYIESPQVRPANSDSDVAMLDALVDQMEAKKVQSLLILGGNPVYDAPGDIDFAHALKSVGLSLAVTNAPSETSALCSWLIPRSHFLEAWGDARALDGTASIVQPLIVPLHESLSDIEVLAQLCGDAQSGYQAVRKTWTNELGDSDRDARWQTALADGVIAGTKSDIVEPVPEVAKTFDPSKSVAEVAKTIAPNSPTLFEIIIKPDPTVWDGRFANNGWLQELPKPLTHTVWDNAAWISPRDAQQLSLKNGDMLSLGDAVERVELPVWIAPGHAPDCLTVFKGYGRTTVGRVGQETGWDVGPLVVKRATTIRADLPVTKVGRNRAVVTTQHFQTMEGRHLARAGSLGELLAQPEAPFAHPPNPAPDASFYPEWAYDGHKWGMTIDLTACVGCSACVIACQAENNVPVVGRDQVAKNRHMHWIRVDTYHAGSSDAPEQTLNQPVTCMHCERAPCEVVCPVAATNHSDEGLNQMVYNRCVGTRYCSNNCPYKVRRFNFLDYSDSFINDPTLHLLPNPEVTIRERGVMEKCTYCVQRIEAARTAAQLENRPIRDGDIKTACQAACPAQAIRFGDLNDPQSLVSHTHDHPLNYGLLEELNTKPRTTYLAQVTNPKETGR